MTKTCAPSLDDLLALQNPAWLWDGDRSRIVWANRAAVDWFGCQSMFEVLDVVFSPDEPSVRELDRIAARLPRGEKVVTALSFSSAISRRAANFACHVHSLADGRTGLLVVMEGDEAVTGALDPQTGMAALMHLPSPLAVIYGSGAVMFENAALSKLFGEAPGGGLSALVNDDGFFDRFVTGAFKAGLVSGIETLETSLGERALQIVVQVLEQKSRIAGTTFLLTFEDITERRALEKSLLTVRQPASTREDARPQAADDKAAALSDIKQKIEEHTDRAAKKQARPDEAGADRVAEIKDDSPAQKAGEGDDDIDVPEIVSGTLNRLPQPIVVFNDSNGSGKILFANNVAVELFGARDWRELDEKTTLASALAALEGEDGSLSLFDLKDNVILLDVIVSTFPWKGGAVFQATLTPTTPEEEADRLLDDTLKKKPQEKDAEGRSAALNTERPAQVAASPAPEAGDSAETPEDDEARA
ncbi:MAG TPA: PAS domain-containing protein, partial [Rhizobiales bacterium]|nr:PAS domain-containing protein [Hyphomicrobiales bacterium]